MNTYTTCHECGDKVDPGDEWYISANDDPEVYGDCCVEACDTCGTTDKIEELVHVFAEVNGEAIRYQCTNCHKEN